MSSPAFIAETASLLNEEIRKMDAPIGATNRKRPLQSSSSFNIQPSLKRSRTATLEEDALEQFTSSKKTRPSKFCVRPKTAGSPPLAELAQPEKKSQENRKPLDNSDEKLAKYLAKVAAKNGTTKVSTALKPLKFELPTMEARKKNLAELKKTAQHIKKYGDPVAEQKKPKKRVIRRKLW